MKKKYVRDGRSPLPLNDVTSRVMSANKAKGTKPELILRKLLWHTGIKGYRLNWKKAAGTPDIAFPSRKLAIFVNGCFWHRCPYCKPSHPQSHRTFWKKKFENNVLRDKRKISELKKDGWKTLTIWECQIKKNPHKAVARITKLILQNEE